MRHLLALIFAFASAVAAAEDSRQLAPLPPAAEATLRQEMRDNLIALNEIVALLAAGKVREAGQLAEERIGAGAMGQHRSLPVEARPGPHMPQAMHRLGMEMHLAAGEFAKAAAGGDREVTWAALPRLTGACVACHASWRIR